MSKKLQIQALLKAMEKPAKPALPSPPKKPAPPETHIWIDRVIYIKDFNLNYDVGSGYYGDGPTLESAVLTETDLENINRAVREFKETFDLSNIKDFKIDLKNSTLAYKERIANPKLEQHRKKWLAKLKEHEQDLKNYEKLKADYDVALAQYNKDVLVYDLEQTRKRLAELEKKVGSND